MFIEVHMNGRPLMINVDQIIRFGALGTKTRIFINEPELELESGIVNKWLTVDETYKEVKGMITA